MFAIVRDHGSWLEILAEFDRKDTAETQMSELVMTFGFVFRVIEL